MVRKMIVIMGSLFISLPACAADLELVALADGIDIESNKLKQATYFKTFSNENTDAEIAESLRKLKIMIASYEKQLGPAPKVIPPPPKQIIKKGPSQVVLGTTSPAKDTDAVLYTDAKTRKIPFRKIKIEHTSGEYYIRLRDIKIVTAQGKTLLFDAGGGKFYLGDSYEVELPAPTPISEISVRVQHRTNGLEITGVPLPPAPALPTVIELGTTNGVKDGNASLNTQMLHRKVKIRKLMIKHSGGDEYVRLYDLRIITLDDKRITMEISKEKLRPYEIREIELPEPVFIKSIQLRVQHRTNGLIISGVR